jgi:hypothetical protein
MIGYKIKKYGIRKEDDKDSMQKTEDRQKILTESRFPAIKNLEVL